MKRTVLYLVMCLMAITSVSAQINNVALVGAAVGGWPGEPGNPGPTDVHQLTQVDAENWTITINIAAGPCKLRANNTWGGLGFEWAGAWPTAVGTNAGDIICPAAAEYTVTLNTTTGVYNFENSAPLPEVKLVGTAVADPNGVVLNVSGTDQFTATNVTLLTGTGQFSIDGSLSGSTDFPSGAATDPAAFIPIPAGVYSSITFNTGTGDFAFTLAPLNPPVSIVGSAVGGWPGDPGNPGPLDINQMTSTNADGENYTFNALAVTTGGLKFRKDNAWTQSWGGVSFPVGPTVGQEGSDILVVAGQEGTYDVTFTRSTGAYAFSFPTISVVGTAVGGWPGDPGNPGPLDVHQMITTDGATYSIPGLAVTAGGLKFRKGNAWTTSWGGVSFPTGPTVGSEGSDILVVAGQEGTYDVTLNRVTGAYSFTLLSNKGFSTSNFKVYPNPTNNNWNFSSVKENIQSIQIVDVLGKTVMTVNPNNTAANVDASALNAGIYFAKITTASANQTIKLIKN